MLNRVTRNDCVNDSELDIAHWLITKGSFSGTPLEGLDEAWPDPIKILLVEVADESIIQENIGASYFGAELPNIGRCEIVPIKLVLNKSPYSSLISNIEELFLDLIGNAPLKGACKCFDLVLFIGGVSIARNA